MNDNFIDVSEIILNEMINQAKCFDKLEETDGKNKLKQSFSTLLQEYNKAIEKNGSILQNTSEISKVFQREQKRNSKNPTLSILEDKILLIEEKFKNCLNSSSNDEREKKRKDEFQDFTEENDFVIIFKYFKLFLKYCILFNLDKDYIEKLHQYSSITMTKLQNLQETNIKKFQEYYIILCANRIGETNVDSMNLYIENIFLQYHQKNPKNQKKRKTIERKEFQELSKDSRIFKTTNFRNLIIYLKNKDFHIQIEKFNDNILGSQCFISDNKTNLIKLIFTKKKSKTKNNNKTFSNETNHSSFIICETFKEICLKLHLFYHYYEFVVEYIKNWKKSKNQSKITTFSISNYIKLFLSEKQELHCKMLYIKYVHLLKYIHNFFNLQLLCK